MRLARACQAVLAVDGAGLSLLNDDFRIPLGATDDVASLAERLQFTQGEGPCLDTARAQRVLVADSEQLQTRWPLYSHELFTHTPYRAIISLPLALSPDLYGAVDLFLTDPATIRAVSLADAVTATDEIVTVLTLAQAITGSKDQAWSEIPEPAWLHGTASRDRTSVWVAMGMLMTRFDIAAPDALALLRSYAYSHDAVLDDIAGAVVAGTLDLAQLQP